MKQKRNERCSCGSGKKYKKCCLIKDESASKEKHIKDHTIDRDWVYNYLKSLFGT